MKSLEALKKATIEFCLETSLHGLRYIVEPKRSLIERLFWRFVIFAGIVCTFITLFFEIKSVYLTPSIETSIRTMHYPSFLLQQPAITICHADKGSKYSAAEFLKSIKFIDGKKDYFTETLPAFLNYLYDESSTIDEQAILEWDSLLLNNSINHTRFMFMMAQPCSKLLVQCNIGSKRGNCSEIFRISRSISGFCCSVDYESSSFDDPIFNSPNKLQENNSSLQYGFEDGLSLLMNFSYEDALTPGLYTGNAMAHLHSPTDMPGLDDAKRFIPHGKETFIRFENSAIFGYESLKQLSPAERRCYMKDEIKLKYFDHYSPRNCFMESIMEECIRKCDCLIPIYPNNGDYRECPVLDKRCSDKLTTRNITSRKAPFISLFDGKRMECLALCSSVSYLATSSSGEFDAPEFNSFALWDEINVTGLTVVHFFQVAPRVIAYKRTLANSYWNNMAIFGSAVGVTLGLNVLCIIEIIYCFSFRIHYYFMKPSVSQNVNRQTRTKLKSRRRPMKIFATECD